MARQAAAWLGKAMRGTAGKLKEYNMTERSNTAIETADAIDTLLAQELSRGTEPVGTEASGLERARQIIRIFIAATRLHQPPKRGRRPNASKGGE